MERPVPAAIPTTPGIYLYKDAQGRIIYVGKARNLRRRVLSYFRDPARLTAKTRAMLAHAARLDTLSTGTEKEALLLEASLIKKHRPHYNIVLRDDKQYVLFRLGRDTPFPRLEVVRQTKKDRARYFGPFTSGLSARETWKTIHRVFPLRRCTDRALANRVRPCLYHDLGQCLAPCVKKVDPAAYAELVQRVELFLAGRSRELINALAGAMRAASDALEFERAAALRDQLRAVRATVERQSVVLPDGGDLDVAGLCAVNGGLGLGLLFVRDGKLMDGRTFFWPDLDAEDQPELLWSFLGQFYSGAAGRVPPRLVVPELADSDGAQPETAKGPENGAASNEAGEKALPEAENAPSPTEAAPESDSEDGPEVARAALEALLDETRGAPVRVRFPRGAAERALVEMAAANAREAVRAKDETPLAQRLGTALRAPGPVRRVACADVSHTGGRATRVGLVFFEDGKPRKDAYRTYAIEGADGDDYAALSLWAARYAVGDEIRPDLLLIDGGRGQVAAVARALRAAAPTAPTAQPDTARPDAAGTAAPQTKTGLTPHAAGAAPAGAGPDPRVVEQPFPFVLAGIAKARTEDGRADRRAGNVGDHIFLAGRVNPLPLREGAAELLFLQRVRDEAHRFSIGRHRKARDKQALASELTRLPGVGPVMARRLWETFGTWEKICAAQTAELAAVPGLGAARAEKLAAALRAPGAATRAAAGKQ